MRVSKLLLVGFALTLSGSALAAPRLNSVQQDKAAQIDRHLQQESMRGFSGSVLIVQAGRVLLDESYGSIRNVQVRKNSRFYIASISKQFTATAILTLEAQGKLRLTDTIAKYLHGAHGPVAHITILQLLTHSSGLPQNYVADAVLERRKAVEIITAQNLQAEPGTNFIYSNDNYQLAAAIIEEVSGLSYEDYVRRNLLDPAGLLDTGFRGLPEERSVLPARESPPARLQGRQWGIVGSGNLYSTTHDLYKWYEALISGQILRVGELPKLFTPPGGSGAALGWFQYADLGKHRKLYASGNASFGPNGLIQIYPDIQLVTIVLTHGGDVPNGKQSWSRAMSEFLESVLLAK